MSDPRLEPGVIADLDQELARRLAAENAEGAIVAAFYNALVKRGVPDQDVLPLTIARMTIVANGEVWGDE